MFAGKKIIPIPYKGLTRPGDLKKFSRLSDLLTRYLRPGGERPQGRKGPPSSAGGDHALLGAPEGPIAHVKVEGGVIEGGRGSVADPTVTLELANLDTAAALLAGRLDAFAAVGTGDIRIRGLLTMADWAVFGRNGSDVMTWSVQVAREHTGRRMMSFCLELSD